MCIAAGVSVFSLRPAPILASYLGYSHGMGLPEVDYRLTDAIADPFRSGPSRETRVRLPCGFGCFAHWLETGSDWATVKCLHQGLTDDQGGEKRPWALSNIQAKESYFSSVIVITPQHGGFADRVVWKSAR